MFMSIIFITDFHLSITNWLSLSHLLLFTGNLLLPDGNAKNTSFWFAYDCFIFAHSFAFNLLTRPMIFLLLLYVE